MTLEIGGALQTHRDYDANINDWDKVDNVIAGKVTQYLRNVGRNEPDANYAATRQAEYADGAVLHNFTLKTRDGMQGAIFLRAPTIELPNQLEYLLDDCDGNGLGLIQQAQESVDQDLRKGRLGLLVDMPSTEEVPTLAQIESGEIVPRIQLYRAQDILDWKTIRYGSMQKLVSITLREEYDTANGGLGEYTPQYQYRVLGLDGDGYYYQQIWYQQENKEMQVMSAGGSADVYPRINGQLSREIPFYFIGADNNSYKVGTQPLLPIANLNIGHFRNSADTEENSFIASQAMLTISPGENIDPDQWEAMNPNGVVIGSRRGLNLGFSGRAAFIQAEESDKAMKLMEIKEGQAVQLGAQLITPTQQVTAEAARIQQGANSSILSSVAQNVTAAYRKAIEKSGEFLGVTQEVKFALSNDFFYQSLTAQERAQWVSEIMMGITPVDLFYDRLRQTGEIPDDLVNEKVAAMIKEQGPMGMTTEPTNDDIEEEDADTDGDA
jgi:hypothetical protein